MFNKIDKEMNGGIHCVVHEKEANKVKSKIKNDNKRKKSRKLVLLAFVRQSILRTHAKKTMPNEEYKKIKIDEKKIREKNQHLPDHLCFVIKILGKHENKERKRKIKGQTKD